MFAARPWQSDEDALIEAIDEAYQQYPEDDELVIDEVFVTSPSLWHAEAAKIESQPLYWMKKLDDFNWADSVCATLRKVAAI